MTDEVAFWMALSADPADNTRWLVYADWLEDAGRLEAEFVRLFLAVDAQSGEVEFRRGWKRLKALRRLLSPA